MSQGIHLQAAAGALALALTLAAPAAQAADAMRVVRDAATGELRSPNAAETAAFEKAEAQLRLGSGKAPNTAKGPTEIRYPDGTVEMKLGDDTMMYSVVSAAADGSLTFDCLPAQEAKKFVSRKPSSSSKAKTAKVGHEH